MLNSGLLLARRLMRPCANGRLDAYVRYMSSFSAWEGGVRDHESEGWGEMLRSRHASWSRSSQSPYVGHEQVAEEAAGRPVVQPLLQHLEELRVQPVHVRERREERLDVGHRDPRRGA